jgi:hypothetical protein
MNDELGNSECLGQRLGVQHDADALAGRQAQQQAHLVGVQGVEADVGIRRYHFFDYSLLIEPVASIAPLLSR